MADELAINVTADTSGFKSAMEDATESLSGMQDASDDLADSISDLSDAHAAFGGRAADSISHAASAFATYTGQVGQSNDSIRSLQVTAESYGDMLSQVEKAAEVAFPDSGAVELGKALLDTAHNAVELYDKLSSFKDLEQEIAAAGERDADKIGSLEASTVQIKHATGMRDNPLGTLKSDINDANMQLDFLERKAHAIKLDIGTQESIRDSGNYYGHYTSPEEVHASITAQQNVLNVVNAQIEHAKAGIANIQSQLSHRTTTNLIPHVNGDAAEKQMREIEAQYETMRTTYGGTVNPQQALQFWAYYTDTFQRGGDQFLEVMRKYNDALAAAEKDFNGPGMLKKQWDEQQKKQQEMGDGSQQLAIGMDATSAWSKQIYTQNPFGQTQSQTNVSTVQNAAKKGNYILDSHSRRRG